MTWLFEMIQSTTLKSMTSPGATAPAPLPSAPAPSVGERIAARFDLADRRNQIGFAVLIFCAGVMVGARVMRGAVPPMMPGNGNGGLGGNPAVPGVVFRDTPCAGCREREMREAHAAAHPAYQPPAGGGPDNPTSSPPPAAPPDTTTAEVAADIAARSAMADAQLDVQPAPRRFSATAQVDTLPEDVTRDETGQPL